MKNNKLIQNILMYLLLLLFQNYKHIVNIIKIKKMRERELESTAFQSLCYTSIYHSQQPTRHSNIVKNLLIQRHLKNKKSNLRNLLGVLFFIFFSSL